MELKKLGQISVGEIPLLIFLFSIFFIFYGVSSLSFEVDYSYSVKSFLDSICQDDDFRDLIFDEELNSSVLTANWDNYQNIFDKTFINYELVISDNVNTKVIVSCQNLSLIKKKYYVKNAIAKGENSNYNFRTVMFGVCE